MRRIEELGEGQHELELARDRALTAHGAGTVQELADQEADRRTDRRVLRVISTGEYVEDTRRLTGTCVGPVYVVSIGRTGAIDVADLDHLRPRTWRDKARRAFEGVGHTELIRSEESARAFASAKGWDILDAEGDDCILAKTQEGLGMIVVRGTDSAFLLQLRHDRDV
jgi:hypothetical protein